MLDGMFYIDSLFCIGECLLAMQCDSKLIPELNVIAFEYWYIELW